MGPTPELGSRGKSHYAIGSSQCHVTPTGQRSDARPLRPPRVGPLVWYTAQQVGGTAAIWRSSRPRPSRTTWRDKSVVGGQSRHFDHAPVTSGLPRKTDILSVRQHVSKVPIADETTCRDEHRKARPDWHRTFFAIPTATSFELPCDRHFGKFGRGSLLP